ncbi:MAG: LCP family protein [Anaerolineae bacterium]|nr:LCP family protein [Anaerolineae bacterium]
MKLRLFFLLSCLFCLLSAHSLAAQDVVIPEPVPLVDEGAYDIINFLLIGGDSADTRYTGRTDVIMVVSVNRTTGTVALLSIPRDLYVYIPGYRVYRINTAYPHGESFDSVGGGVGLLKDTIEYNLGLHIDYYAYVDFADFRRIIDDLGGVEVSVDCALSDWRLISPELDPNLEESWEQFTLPVGVHAMDGDLALWFARSRRTTSDFDRGRRQQVILRALWGRIRSLDLLSQLTEVWSQVVETVETDIALDDMLTLAPLAATINTDHISSYTFHPNVEVMFSTSPEGSSVLVPDRAAVASLMQRVMQPVTEHQLVQEGARVAILNGSGVGDLSEVAADRLAWEGFVPHILNETASYQPHTTVVDYTGSTKGSSLGVLLGALRVDPANVISEPSPEREVDFQVILGGDYNSCTYGAMPEADD